jgi:hypothetical protein
MGELPFVLIVFPSFDKDTMDELKAQKERRKQELEDKKKKLEGRSLKHPILLHRVR